MATLDTAPKTILRRSLGTAFEIKVFAIGVIKPIKNPAMVLNIPKPHTFGIRYWRIKNPPTPQVAVNNIFGIDIHLVMRPIEIDASALNRPAPKIITPTMVATKSSFTCI